LQRIEPSTPFESNRLSPRLSARLSLRISKPILLMCLSLAFLLPAPAQTPLRVAAAADLEPVLPPILEQFHQSTGIRAEATYQASAMLTTQIMNGAPFDLFLSADLSYPKKLIDAGLADAAGSTDSTTPITYAKGTLVLWTRKDSALGPPSLDLLRNPALKRLAIANPDRAPYGRAAVAALTSLKLYDALSARLVTAENIAQAAQFVDSTLTPVSSPLPQRSRPGWHPAAPSSSSLAISIRPSSRAQSSSPTQPSARPPTSFSTSFSLHPSRPSLPRAASHPSTRTRWTGKRSHSHSSSHR